jgi:hypothetical protein
MCKKTATFARPINAVVEFWECEDHHMFVVDKKPPPKVSAAKAPPADAAASAVPATATATTPVEPKTS